MAASPPYNHDNEVLPMFQPAQAGFVTGSRGLQPDGQGLHRPGYGIIAGQTVAPLLVQTIRFWVTGPSGELVLT